MSEPAPTPLARDPSPVAHVLLYALLAVPLSVLVFLASAGAFQAWEGTVNCFDPGRADASARDRSFLLVRPGAPDIRVRLPAAALASRDLPACSAGLPSLRRTESAVPVHKRRYRLFVEVDGRPWPTPRPDHLLLTLGCLVLGFPLWNLATVGAPFRVSRRMGPEVPIPVEEIEVPGVRQQPSGRVVPPKDRGSVGPPPSGRQSRRRKA